jgi:hypothetical protein
VSILSNYVNKNKKLLKNDPNCLKNNLKIVDWFYIILKKLLKSSFQYRMSCGTKKNGGRNQKNFKANQPPQKKTTK